MRVLRSLEEIPAGWSPSTVAVGTFDGIHIGHRAILKAAIADARSHGRQSVAFTFDRHPAELLAPERAPRRITTPDQQRDLIADCGIDWLVVAPFDARFAAQPPQQFIDDVLVNRLRAGSVVVGSGFRFGRDRAGDTALLCSAANARRFVLHALEPVMEMNEPASSSRIRNLLMRGAIGDAEAVLNHAWVLSGTVTRGAQLGRTLGYPTANLLPAARQITPADGIYAAAARLESGEVVAAAASLGARPSVPGAGRALEFHLLDFDGDLYGSRLDIRFVRCIRAAKKFDSLEALKGQIGDDAAVCRELLDGDLPEVDVLARPQGKKQ
ncbi:MAG: bifunctional riboflavin kinase/FAD synthetase [Armatimonadetes bacterium]|nr:bifunctional riboflavin kinase/FAD synthetase [Armatimonadota bacterium]MDE2206581.1 bifunctional riboflavin kinase/FAD synthetase [Armatimonadota bacterium]